MATKLSDLSPIEQYELAKGFGQFNGTYSEFLKSRPASQASQTAASPVPQINELTPDQINEQFNKGYPEDLPQRKTFRDYINPASYVDPIAKAYEQQRRSDPISQILAEQRFSAAPQDQADATANRGSMSNAGNLTDYFPSMNTLSGLIPREIPNVFGVNNPLYAGLLGEPQSQALSKQSNIAGLLGAAAALVQGMGRQGGRRSAAQNIISALGAGYGSAGQQYQQGLQMYGQTQQLALQQRQQAAIQAMKLKYPEYADEIDANPAGAFRLIAERETANKKGIVVDGNLVNPITGAVIFKSTKPQARMLTNQEAADANLPYKEGQIYQVDANGKIDLIQGTGSKSESFSGEYANVALDLYGTADVSKLDAKQRAAVSAEAERRGVAKSPKITNVLETNPALRAEKLSANSQKFTANKPISQALEIASRYDNFSKAYNNPQAGGASDAVLIYSMAKMLDPEGAVQQGDVGTIAGQKSIPEKLKAIHEQFISNRTLSDEQRENLNAMAYSIVKNKQKSITPIIKQYRNYATAMASPDPTADVQDPFQNIELPKQRLVTINKKKTQVRLGNDGNYYYTDPTGKNYIYND